MEDAELWFCMEKTSRHMPMYAQGVTVCGIKLFWR